MMSRVSLIAVSVVLLSGCQMMLTSSKGIPETSSVELERRPSGSPSVDVTASPSKDRWTVQVRQPFGRITEVQTTTRQQARRYLFWPLAPFSGLLQCPVGLVASVFSSSSGATNMRQVGCMRLIAMEPLRNTIDQNAITDRQQITQESVSTVAGVDVLFTPDDDNQAQIRRVTMPDGLAIIQAESSSDQQGELRVRMDNRTLLKQRIQMKGQPDRARPSLSWPEAPIVQIDGLMGSDGKPRAGFEETLSALLLSRGVDVLPSQRSRDAILDEQAVQLTGRVSDQSAIKAGRLLRPTVLIKGCQSLESDFSVTVTVVKTGEQQEIHIKQLADLLETFPKARRSSKDTH